MAIGAHELLLIVRAQNQASALLGRVGRDFRRLQNMRDLEMQRARQINQMAKLALAQQQQMAKIQSVMSANGKARLQHELNVARILAHEQNIENRIVGLEVRRTAIARAEVNLEVQRMRILQQQAGLESTLEKIELRRKGINVQASRLATSILRNSGQQQALTRRQYGLETQLMQRRLAATAAAKAAAKAESDRMRLVGGGVRGAPQTAALAEQTAAQIRSTIAQRKVIETQMALAEIPGQRGLLSSQAATLRKQIPVLSGQLAGLKTAEAEAASAAAIQAKRLEALNIQMANLNARSTQVNLTEKELRQQLQLTGYQLGIESERFAELEAAADAAAIAVQHNVESQRILAAAVADTNAEMAAQRGEKMQTIARATSHVGRVLTAVGLIGVAAFGAMAVSAAKFNTETTRASTQTGNIFTSNAQTIAAGATKIGNSITDIMQTIPADAHDLANSFYYIYSTLNTTLGQGTKLVKLFSQAWLAGGMVGSVEDVSKALVTLGNNWGISAKSGEAFRSLVASTMATVRFGGLDLEQYTQTLNQLAPAFRGANQSIEEMNGAIAFLTRLMPSQGQAATGIARLMQQMSRLAARPAPGFEKLAKDIQDANGNLLPFSQVLDIIIKEHPEIVKSGVALQNFWKAATGNQGTAMAYKAFQAFVRQHKLYGQILRQTSGDQNEFNRSLKAMEASTGVRWEVFISQMKAFALELGTAVVPMLLSVSGQLQKLAKWWHRLSDEQKKNYGHWAGLIAIGTLAAGVLASIAGGAALFIMSMRTLAGVFGKGKGPAGEMGALGAEAGFVNTKLVLVGASLAIAVPLLKVFGVDAGKAATNSHNLAMALKLVEYYLTALMVKGVLGRFASFRGELVGAAGAAGLLRLRLLRLAKIGVITVGIQLLLSGGNRYNKNDQWNMKGILQALNPLNYGRDLFSAFGAKDKRPNSQPVAPGTLGKVAPRLIANNIKTMFVNANAEVGTGTTAVEAKVREMYKNLGEKDKPLLDKWIAQGKNAAKQWNQAMGNIGKGLDTSKNVSKSLQPFTGSEFLAAIRQAYKLKQALDNATSLEAGKRALKAYTDYIKKVTKDFTKEQVKEFDTLLGMMDQFGADSATHTQAQITAMVGHINKLNKQLAKHPSIALSAQIAKETKALNKAAFGDQQSIAENYFSAVDALDKTHTSNAKKESDKRKKLIEEEYKKQLKRQQDAQSTMKSVMSNLMQISQSAFQQYQSDLGTIFQGPWMTGSIMGRRQQFGFSARPEDLLKDMRMSVQHAEKFQGSLSKLRKRGAPDELVSQIRQLGPEAQKQLDTLLAQKPEVFARYVKWFKRGQHDAHVAAMTELKSELKKWRSHGRAVALAIAAGLRDEDVALQMALSKMVAKMFPGTHAIATTRPTRKGAAAAVDSRGGRTAKGNYVVHDNRVTYNIHPSQKGESLQHMLRRTHFFYRNRK